MNMRINKAEYFILDSVLTNYNILRNVAFERRLLKSEVAVEASRLFDNGDILAAFPIENKEISTGISLGFSQIKRHLNGEFNFFYYLTPQGGSKWEALSHPDWNLYHQWHFYDNNKSEIICQNQAIIKQLLSLNCILYRQIPLPQTEIWDELEPWQATYWKTLPKAHRVRYQSTSSETFLESKELREANNELKRWYKKALKWYKYPKFERNTLIFLRQTEPNYYATIREISSPKAEYLILKMAVVHSSYGLSDVAYSEELSDSEIVVAAHSLFERGDIRAKVFADEYDQEGSSDVILTKVGIQDHLDGRIRLSYYLTPQGGARWEALANPNWEKFIIVNYLGNFPYEQGILGTQKNNLEKLLAIDKFILSHQHIPGTEVWEVKEPWKVTYWKTLQRGYHVRCEYKPNDLHWYFYMTDTQIFEECEAAFQWYENLKKWFTDPQF